MANTHLHETKLRNIQAAAAASDHPGTLVDLAIRSHQLLAENPALSEFTTNAVLRKLKSVIG